MHRGKNPLVASEVADLLDPLPGQITRMRAADPGCGGRSISRSRYSGTPVRHRGSGIRG